MRSLAFRTARSWTRNPNYRHGAHSKARWDTETRVNRGMTQLPATAARIAALGHWRAQGLDAGLRALMDHHPKDWTVPGPTGARTGLYVPTRCLPQAHAWLRVLRALQARLRRVLLEVAAFRLRISNDRRNAHGDTTERRQPILGGAPMDPRIIEPRQISAAVAQIMGRWHAT